MIQYMAEPLYISAYQNGTLQNKIDSLEEIISSCTLCPHRCKINRRKESSGYCNSSVMPIVSSYAVHQGEEPPITGYHGSGTIFFTNCNLNCIFCQNCDISQMHYGQEITYNRLSDMMIELQEQGCHNINFVSPTHMMYAIVKALPGAIEQGLRIPLVYNSGGYDSLETLKIAEDLFDIYLPDFKFMDEKLSYSLSNARYYSRYARMAIMEMYEQVGNLKMDNAGVAVKGLLVRHLILPGYIQNSKEVIKFLSGISKEIFVNVMDQYHPEYRATEDIHLTRPISRKEYEEVVQYAIELGMRNINRFD